MSLSIKVLGCNGLCASCYENSVRERKAHVEYDIEAIRKTLREEALKIRPEDRKKWNPPCVHGGEPLLMKPEDLEALFSDIKELYGRVALQTNGMLINDPLIEMFKTYGVSVGVSLDGDTAELNYGRWNASMVRTELIQSRTDQVLANILKCKEAGLNVSVISVLRKYNAGTKEKVDKFIMFLRRLSMEFKVFDVRTNPVIVYDSAQAEEEQLNDRELGYAFRRLADVCFEHPALQWRPYRDVVGLLLGDFNQTCVFGECDIWKTTAEQPIGADGSIGNCLKGGAGPDGYQALAAERYSNERYIVLRQIPQEFGGCRGCKYWVMCKGGCPGEGLDNDWRNKTRFCGPLRILYSHVETRLRGLMPFRSLSIDRTCPVVEAAESYGHSDKHGDAPHGDHTDAPHK